MPPFGFADATILQTQAIEDYGFECFRYNAVYPRFDLVKQRKRLSALLLRDRRCALVDARETHSL